MAPIDFCGVTGHVIFPRLDYEGATLERKKKMISDDVLSIALESSGKNEPTG